MSMPMVLLTLAGFLLVTAAGFCQPISPPAPAALAGRPIRDIQFAPANTLHTDDLAKLQLPKSGDLFQPDDAARAIDTLFATGWFDDIAVEAEPDGDGVRIRYVTTPSWFVGGVSVEGKVIIPPNRGQVANTAAFRLGEPFHDEDVQNAVNSIKELLTANGFYGAAVEPAISRDPDAQQVFLTFHVKEGKRAKYEMPLIEGNSRLLSDSTVIRATGWRLPVIHWWRTVTDSATRNGVHGVLSKYQSKDRLNAKVELEKLDYDAEKRRVRPSLKLEPGPVVKIEAQGAKVSGKVLKRYVPVYQEKATYTELLVEGRRNLEDYFQSRGYYDAEVDFRVTSTENDTQKIEYIIERGNRYKLKTLNINGNRYFGTGVIRERMFMTPASFGLRRGRYSEAFRRKDEENIVNLYKSNGFQDVKVSAVVDRNNGGNAGDTVVTMTIEEGPQWMVDAVTLNGSAKASADELKGQLASLPGQPFAEVTLARDRSTILTWYFEHGFPDAKMKAEWTQSSPPTHVNVAYTVQEGEQQFVREVVTTGLRTTRRSLVERDITLHPGDPLSPVQQTDIQKRLYDRGVFARVETAVQNPEGETEHKYVLYNFEEANRYNLAFGFGLQVGRFGTPSSTSVSNPGGQTGISPQASVDVSRLNFLGRGHTVSFRGLYSNIQKRASITYLQPRFQNTDGRNITYSLLYDNALNVRTFSSKREEASIQISQQFSKSLSGQFRLAYRRVSVNDVVIPVLLVPQFVQPVRLGMVSASLSQDRRDNPSDPHRGIFNTLDIGIAARYLGSERSFGRALGRNATYYRLTKTIVLARQTQFGILAPFSPPAGISREQSVPLPERFFGGGADSLRAFSFNQAGPRDTGAPLVAGGPSSQPTGFPLGGNALLTNNVELRFPLLGNNVQGTIFHDMGNVFSSAGAISFRYHQKDLQDFNYMVHAVGFGIRYKTPVGPVRLDLAYALNPPSYLGFGGTAQQLLSCDPNLPPASLPSYCASTRQNSGHFQFFFSIGQTF